MSMIQNGLTRSWFASAARRPSALSRGGLPGATGRTGGQPRPRELRPLTRGNGGDRSLGPLSRVTAGWTMPALSTKRAHLFLATYGPGDRVEAGSGLAKDRGDIAEIEISLNGLA